MAEDGHLPVQQRAKTKSVTTVQRKFWTIFQTCSAPARNNIIQLFKKLEEVGSMRMRHIICGSRRSKAALANQRGRQLMSMEFLTTQCKEYFEQIWKCFCTKLLWRINFLTMTKKGNFSSQTGQKEKIKFFSRNGFWTRLFLLFGWDCEKTEHVLLGDRTS